MSLPFGLTVTFQIMGIPTSQDSLGNDVYTPTAVVVPGCAFAPGGSGRVVTSRSSENDGVNDQVVTQPTVYVPTGTALGPIDRAIVPGYGEFEVDGAPQVWPPHPMTGWQPPNSIVVTLKQVSG